MAAARNIRTWRIVFLLTIVAALCFVPATNTANAAEQIDQSNLPEWGGSWTHINPDSEGSAAMWQKFTPTSTNMVAVKIDILTISPGLGDDVLTVEIVKDGEILGSTDCLVTDGFDGLLRFEFPDAVPLVPEEVYELMVHDTGTTRFGWRYGSNTYERGSRYVFAQERPDTDWFFQTYSNIEPAETKYSGGTGDPNDPYQIATAEDLMLLGETPEDYDKHFILVADIDLDPNLPGRKVFDKAAIAPLVSLDTWDNFQGIAFTGVFDGDGHTISHLTIRGGDYLGLFGLAYYQAIVSNLGLEAVDVNGTGDYIGSLVGINGGSIVTSYSSGTVSGTYRVGGLVGYNGGTLTRCNSTSLVYGNDNVGGLAGCNSGVSPMWWKGSITESYSSGSVRGNNSVGGLVGVNDFWSSITESYSSGSVNGISGVGGLVGSNSGGDLMWPSGSITASYSSSSVSGTDHVGGFVGGNLGSITESYSSGSVSGTGDFVGGFAGINVRDLSFWGMITTSFWDIQTSSTLDGVGNFYPDTDGIVGKTTAEMQTANTFLEAGWDFVDENNNGTDDIWKMWDGYDYPRLAWEPGPNKSLVFTDINDPGFYGQMSKYEVTNAQYCDFLNATLASGDITINGTDVYGSSGSNSGDDYIGQRYYCSDGSGYTGYGATNGGAARIHYNEGSFSVEEDFDNHPVTYVSWYGAMAFAEYYGYYLPSEDQWQAVADYDGTYIYGCGETINPGIANYRNTEHPDGTTSVGSFGIYGYGMSDMAGNVWEWTSSHLGTSRIFRGGSMGSIDSSCDVSIRSYGIPYANNWDIGFRVCR